MAHQSHGYYNLNDGYTVSPDDYFGTYGSPNNSYISSPHIMPAQLVNTTTSNQQSLPYHNNISSTVSYSSRHTPSKLATTTMSSMWQDYGSSPASPSTTSGISTPQLKDSSEEGDMSSPITFIEEYSVGVSRKERRKQQNRNSQRAFRERTRLREEHLSGQVTELQTEVGKLREQERTQSQVIETLVWENETLKDMLAM